jgi:N-acetylmuramoyl-L-alanine amidase
MPIVVLDPGHGGQDSGATGLGLVEKDLALRLALQVADSLRQNYVVDVRMTRDLDVFISLSGRVGLANSWGGDYYVSLHLNAGGGEGFESYIYLDTQGTETETMQTQIHETVMNYLGTYGVRDRGKKQADFAVLRGTHMPAVLLENLFVDGAMDASLLKQDSFLLGLSEAITHGIAKAMNLQSQSPAVNGNQSNSPAQNTHWALGAANELQAAGFLEDDHSKTLDNPASEGMVIALFNRLRKSLGIEHYSEGSVPATSNVPSTHWAKQANDEMMAAGLLESDHTPYLDEPATEAMVIVVADRIWRAAKQT